MSNTTIIDNNNDDNNHNDDELEHLSNSSNDNNFMLFNNKTRRIGLPKQDQRDIIDDQHDRKMRNFVPVEEAINMAITTGVDDGGKQPNITGALTPFIEKIYPGRNGRNKMIYHRLLFELGFSDILITMMIQLIWNVLSLNYPSKEFISFPHFQESYFITLHMLMYESSIHRLAFPKKIANQLKRNLREFGNSTLDTAMREISSDTDTHYKHYRYFWKTMVTLILLMCGPEINDEDDDDNKISLDTFISYFGAHINNDSEGKMDPTSCQMDIINDNLQLLQALHAIDNNYNTNKTNYIEWSRQISISSRPFTPNGKDRNNILQFGMENLNIHMTQTIPITLPIQMNQIPFNVGKTTYEKLMLPFIRYRAKEFEQFSIFSNIKIIDFSKDNAMDKLAEQTQEIVELVGLYFPKNIDPIIEIGKKGKFPNLVTGPFMGTCHYGEKCGKHNCKFLHLGPDGYLIRKESFNKSIEHCAFSGGWYHPTHDDKPCQQGFVEKHQNNTAQLLHNFWQCNGMDNVEKIPSDGKPIQLLPHIQLESSSLVISLQQIIEDSNIPSTEIDNENKSGWDCEKKLCNILYKNGGNRFDSWSLLKEYLIRNSYRFYAHKETKEVIVMCKSLMKHHRCSGKKPNYMFYAAILFKHCLDPEQAYNSQHNSRKMMMGLAALIKGGLM